MKYKFTNKDLPLYLDWRNNFLTIRNFADHHNLNVNYAGALINHFYKKYNKNKKSN